MGKIREMCAIWLGKNTASKKELQSLLGLLLYVSKCIKVARIFLSRMLDTLRAHHDKNMIILDTDFKKDILWFYTFAQKFNGVAFFDKRPVKVMIELDASLTGIGGVCGNFVYTVPISLIQHHEENSVFFSIVHWEMYNILVALKLWGGAWKNQKVNIKCDNQAVVSILNTGKSSDKHLCTLARNILFLCACNDIHLTVIHVLGKNNIIADTLSRWFENGMAPTILKKHLINPCWVNVNSNDLHIDWSI